MAIAALVLAGLPAVLTTGCRTPSINSARHHFQAGRIEQAEKKLDRLPPDGHRDKILYLMERGVIRQTLYDLESSTADWLQAVELLERTEPYSVSRGAASLLINDRTLTFRGLPFERTLLRTMLAGNFLMRADWQSAAVEARNIIATLEELNGFPDDAFSRYVAGFCLEMTGDREGAALQYRMADTLLDELLIDDRTGRFWAAEQNDRQSADIEDAAADLVVFAMLGSRGTPGSSKTAHVEFFNHGAYLGRSYQFADTLALRSASMQRLQTLQTAKDVSRIVIKETVIQTLLRENEGLGMLAGILLYSLEHPDTRRWETLPDRFHVARFRVPSDLENIVMVFRDAAGTPLLTMDLSAPAQANRGKFVMLCRESPPFPPD